MTMLQVQTRQQVPDFHVTGFIGIDRPEWAAKDVTQTERPVVYATASSTSPDLDSDRMSDRAIQQMATGFIGLTIFLNHRYAWPEDIFGAVLRTHVVERDGFKDLDMEIAVEDQNPRALTTYSMIKNGTRAGVSVGILVVAYEATDDKHLGRKVIEITDVLPLEASIAGIPSNRRSWVRDAIKSLCARGEIELDQDAMSERPWLQEAEIERKVWEETENEIRFRVRNPDDFEDDSFRRIALKKDKPRVFAIIGKLKGEDTTTIQSLRFPKEDEWTMAKAKDWVKEHPDVLKSLEEIEMTTEFKGAVPFKEFPLAERGSAWDADASVAALRKWAGGPDTESIDWGKYAQGFTWVDSENAEKFGSYKMPHHKPETVFKGVAAVAVVLAGGRGGVDIPAGDVAGVKSHIAKHYAEFDEKAPWEREGKDFAWLPDEVEAAKALEIDLAEAQKALFPEADGEQTPGKLAGLQDSIAQRLVEQEFARAFWQLNYAFADAVWDVLENGDSAMRIDTVRSLLDEFGNMLLNLVNSMPQVIHDGDEIKAAQDYLLSALEVSELMEKAGARHSAADQDMIQSLHDLAAKLGAACQKDEQEKSADAGLDKDAGVGETKTDEMIVNKVAELTAQVEAAEAKAQAAQAEANQWKVLAEESKQVIEQILDLPLAIKTQDGDSAGDAARKVINRYPGVSSYVQSLLDKQGRHKEK